MSSAPSRSQNRNEHLTTKVTKSTKLRNSNEETIFESFVSFVRFVVK